jgi:hypothetical protein
MRGSAWVWLAATLEAIAIPIARPSCWEVFRSPEASPARGSAIQRAPLGETHDMRLFDIDDIEKGRPDALRRCPW